MTHNNGNKNDPKKAGIAGTALEKSGNKFLVMGQWHSHGEVGLENTHWFLRGLAIPPDVPRRSHCNSEKNKYCQEVYIDQCKPLDNSKILLLLGGLHWSM